ncbi:organic cation transporter protein-like isoform X2 [Mytilus trossulus]|uniref:organic cation transporter protein-like isoform X2 n=1 Tax=Mytilus trossulus TaxID=6551 RepID=UPI00300457CF
MNSKRNKYERSHRIMHFDDLLKILGEFGRYQQIRLFLICLVAIVCAFHAMNMVFVGAKPDYKCHVPSVNVSDPIFGNTTEKDFQDFLQSAGKCEIYDARETSKLILSGNYTLDGIKVNNGTVPKSKCTEWDYSREVYGPTIVTQFDLVCDKDWLRSTSKTLYFFGRLVGAVVFGQLSDILGRKPTLFTCLLMLLIVGSIASAAPNFYVFIPFYILQGAAQTGLFLVTFTLGTELVGPSYRLVAGFLVQSFYSIGYMTLSVLAYGIRDWRYIELAITLPVVLFVPYIWLLPESVRWLLSKHKEEEVKNIVRKVADTNKVDINEEMLEDLTKTDDKSETETTGRRYTLIDLCRPGMIFLSLNVWFNWLVNAMLYYGLSLGTDNLGGDPYINFCIAGAVEIPAYIMCILMLNPLGRRRPLFATMVVGGGACIASGFIEMIPLKITLAMIGKFCITASYAIIYLMAAEVFPTVVRNIGMGVSSMCARIGGMLAPQILELNRFWGPLPLILFGGLAIFSGALALLLPETSGKPLPQTMEDVTDPEKRKATEKGIDMTVCSPDSEKNGK